MLFSGLSIRFVNDTPRVVGTEITLNFEIRGIPQHVNCHLQVPNRSPFQSAECKISSNNVIRSSAQTSQL